MPPTSGYTIDSLARGLAVLSSFAPGRTELTLAEIAEITGVSKGTAFRIAHTLTEAGYLSREEGGRAYRLGATAVSVGLETLASMSLPTIAEPVLLDLRDRSGETAQLAVPDDLDAVLVGRLPSRRFPPNTVYVGHRVPIHAGSLGRAMLSALDERARRELLARCDLSPSTRRSRTSVGQVLASVAQAARRGFALNDQETTLEHRSLGAPLVTPSGRPVGSVNITVSASRVTARDLQRKHASTVVEAAQRISALLPESFAGRQYAG